MSLAKITNTFINVKNLSIFSIASLMGYWLFKEALINII